MITSTTTTSPAFPATHHLRPTTSTGSATTHILFENNFRFKPLIGPPSPLLISSPAQHHHHHHHQQTIIPAASPTSAAAATSALFLQQHQHNNTCRSTQRAGPPPQFLNLIHLPKPSAMDGATLNGLTQVTLENGISAIHNSGEDSNSARSSPSAGTGSGSNGSVSGYENKLFVGGLSWQTTPEKLRDYFSQFGPVTDVLVMKDPITQRSRGFGFITFNDSTTVPRVLGVPVHMLDGKRIDPKHATPRSKAGSNKTKKVFVGGVSQETSVEEVKAYFSQFGKVEEAVMLMDQQTKRHRGFGFVTFDSEDVVDRICEIHFHTIKGKKVECKKAQPKETVASLNLLAKRMVLPLTAASTLAAQASLGGVQMAPAVAAAAAANYSKLLSAGLSYPSIGNYRYTPYPLPSLNAANSNTMPSLSATPAYGAYALPTSVDVSGLQNLDWSGVYNAYV